ncbi:NAD(+) diphosphatase [Roseovarius faecimaris]|uniref:NAD(+) diphosphatase n=1 Tax=Roseovarius faecimaris TaxID=2494550 RepID=A0A6I6ITG2_9RHOB|nr:NAD(+) diphosphatase [Roseovarius faecimaris]QGX99492.1 NAD(+) diphosphatase [Roseovarius faecimaris]
MDHAETVTFGGSGLDRVAELRGDAQAIDYARSQGLTRTIVLWRGKPLVRAGELDRLVRLPLEHPALADATLPPILLGREESGILVFATDISGWEPAGPEAESLGAFVDQSEQRHPDLEDAVFAELRRIMTRLTPRDAELAATAKALAGWQESHRFCARCGAESEMILSGWQRSCPACNAQHFPRTDPVVIMLITHGNRTLLGRSHGWPEGMYSCLAGFIEPGETLEAAVRREVWEEAGIRVGRVRYLASQPWAFPSSLMLGAQGEALNTEIVIDPSEIEEAIWVTREELLQAWTGDNPRLLPARKGAIAHFLLHNWLADKVD